MCNSWLHSEPKQEQPKEFSHAFLVKSLYFPLQMSDFDTIETQEYL